MNDTQRPANQLWSILAVVLFLAVMLFDGAYCWKRAEGPTDSIAYASLIASDSGNNFGAEDLDCFNSLTGPNRGCPNLAEPYFAATLKYTPQEYRTFLRFYEVKPAYVFLLKRLHRNLHLSVFGALKAVSVTSFLLLGAVIWFWFREHFTPIVATALAATLINTSLVIYLGKQLLPDGMSVALLLLAVYLLIYRKNKWPGAIVLALLPIARPDNIIFVGVFGAALVWRMQRPQKERLRYLLLFVIGCGLMQLGLKWATHPLPWSILLYHSTLGWGDPSSYETLHISTRMYLHILAFFGTRTLLTQFPLIAFFATLALVGRGIRPLRDLIWVSAVVAAVRFLLFPSMEERFYAWFLLICVLVATCAFGEMLRKTSTGRAEISEAAAD